MTAEPRVYVIHENAEWFPPFAAAFEAEGVPAQEWLLTDGSIDLNAEPPAGVFWSRLSASAHTRDHGDTWESQQSGSGALLLGVHAADDGEVVITAMREMLFSRDAGSSWKQVEAPAVKGSWYVGVAQADARSAVLAVGQAGQIVRLDP